MMNSYRKSLFLLSFAFFFSCNSNRWEVETEKVNLQLETNRFELDLFNLAADGLTNEEVKALKKQYSNFFPLYTEGIMQFGTANSSYIAEGLTSFTQNEDILALFNDVEEAFPENSLTNKWKQLEDGFKRYHYYFPQRIVPEVHTMIAAFNYSTAVADSVLAIGIEMYMGADYELYSVVGIPKYKSKNFTIDYILTDAMNAWLSTEFEVEGGKNLLEQMIYRGKIAYVTKALLPESELAYVFNYNQDDLTWCEKNESGIWSHFVDMELLFATESNQIRKYMGDAPFVTGFPEGSPGRVGHWVGYRIVEAFMDNNKEVGLSDLMQITDANRVLRKSKYKPNR